MVTLYQGVGFTAMLLASAEFVAATFVAVATDKIGARTTIIIGWSFCCIIFIILAATNNHLNLTGALCIIWDFFNDYLNSHKNCCSLKQHTSPNKFKFPLLHFMLVLSLAELHHSLSVFQLSKKIGTLSNNQIVFSEKSNHSALSVGLTFFYFLHFLDIIQQ